MNSWIFIRAGAGRLLGIAIALAGFVVALSFISRSLLSARIADPVLGALPQLPDALLTRMHKLTWIPDNLHSALVFAVLGIVAMAIGALIARGQEGKLESEKRRREDARRRVQHYRESARIEPTF